MQDDHSYDQSAAHGGKREEADKEKTKMPKEHQHLVSRGRASMDKRKLQEYSMNEKETIEMTALLVDGKKNKGCSPTR